MDHRAIDAGSVAERYVTGRLSPEEAAEFEEHYLDCPSCIARVEAAERLERGLKRLAEEAAGGVRSFRPSRPPQWVALAAAAALAATLGPAWLVELREARRLRADLARVEGGKGTVERLAAIEGELQRTRRDLAAEAEKRAALAEEMAADRKPQTDLPVVPLTPVRGSVSGAPVRTLKLPAKPGWVALWVEPGDASYPAYRATLRTAGGAVVFTAPRLRLNDLGALLVTVHSASLSSGVHRLDLDGLPATGAPVPVGRFDLRVE